MGVPFSDEASLRWALIAFEFLIGIVLIYNSKNQPFRAQVADLVGSSSSSRSWY